MSLVQSGSRSHSADGHWSKTAWYALDGARTRPMPVLDLLTVSSAPVLLSRSWATFSRYVVGGLPLHPDDPALPACHTSIRV